VLEPCPPKGAQSIWTGSIDSSSSSTTTTGSRFSCLLEQAQELRACYPAPEYNCVYLALARQLRQMMEIMAEQC
jgi:hypothetical protein